MADYIKREDAIAHLENEKIKRANRGAILAADEDDIIRWLNTLSTADVREVVHARWEEAYFSDENGELIRDCSNCNKPHTELSPYCPNCGAMMEG